MIRSLIRIACFFAALAVAAAACHFGEEEDPDKGLTGDVGDECGGICEDFVWCYDSNLQTCVSSYCVGPAPDAMYCTEPCDFHEACPDGYLCTMDCPLDSSEQGYCVKEADYEALFEAGLCDTPPP